MSVCKITQNNLFLIVLFANSAWFSGMIKAADAAELAQANENLIAYVRAGDAESAAIALDNGADPNMPVFIAHNSESLSLLGYVFRLRMTHFGLSADQQNNLDRMIALLIERGADPTAEYERSSCKTHPRTVLAGLAYLGKGELVELALSNGANSNAEDDHGNTVFLCAAFFRPSSENERLLKGKIYNVLAKYKADVTKKNKYGSCPLTVEALAGDHTFAQQLVGLKADINAKDNNGKSILHKAFYLNEKSAEVLKKLFQLGADPWSVHVGAGIGLSPEGEKKRQLIYTQRETCIAAARVNDRFLQGYVRQGPQIDMLDFLFKLPSERTDQLLLLAQVINDKPNCLSNMNGRAGSVVATDPVTALAKDVRAMGRTVHAPRDFEKELYLAAAVFNHWNALSLFHVVSPNATCVIKSDNRISPVSHGLYECFDGASRAICLERASVMQLFIDNGVNFDIQDSYGVTLAMKAAEAGDWRMVKFLADKGANLNIRSPWSALCYACKGKWKCNLLEENDANYQKIIDVLLDKGVDINVNYQDVALPFEAMNMLDRELLQKFLKANVERGEPHKNTSYLRHITPLDKHKDPLIVANMVTDIVQIGRVNPFSVPLKNFSGDLVRERVQKEQLQWKNEKFPKYKGLISARGYAMQLRQQLGLTGSSGKRLLSSGQAFSIFSKQVKEGQRFSRISSHAVPNFVLTTRSTVSPWLSWIKVDTRPAAIKQYMVRNGVE